MLIKREASSEESRFSFGARRVNARKPRVKRQASLASAARTQIGNSSENRRDRPIIRRSPIGARVSSPPRGRLARPLVGVGEKCAREIAKQLMRADAHPLFSMRLTRDESSMGSLARARAAEM